MSKKESQLDHKDLYQKAPCGMICTSPMGEVLEVNDRFLEFTGYTREEVIGKKHFVDFLNKAGRMYYDTTFTVILQIQNSVNELIFSLVKKDNTELSVLINAINVKNDAGETKYVQSIIVDISHRKQFESQLITAKKNLVELTRKLSEANENLESFAYVATHDLKAPINNIEGVFSILKDTIPKDEDSLLFIKYIEDSITQFKTTVKGLEEAIKVYHTNTSLERLLIEEIIDEIIQNFVKEIEREKGIIETKLSNDGVILGHKIYVQSIIRNIISNSIKYQSPDRPLRLQITTNEISDYICIKITDNGLGMDMNVFGGKIFGLFTRYHTHTEGTGMGLHIVKKMTEQMKGKITVESELNKGTTFKVYFRKD
jgi:PAS domain S-box-containing protein